MIQINSTNLPKFKTREEALEDRAHHTGFCLNVHKILLIANDSNQTRYDGMFTIPEDGYDEGLLRMFQQCGFPVPPGRAFCKGCQMSLELDL